MVEHTEKGKRYCCPEHATSQERVRWRAQWRQIAMGNDSPLAAIFDPASRAKRRKRLRTGKP